MHQIWRTQTTISIETPIQFPPNNTNSKNIRKNWIKAPNGHPQRAISPRIPSQNPKIEQNYQKGISNTHLNLDSEPQFTQNRIETGIWRMMTETSLNQQAGVLKFSHRLCERKNEREREVNHESRECALFLCPLFSPLVFWGSLRFEEQYDYSTRLSGAFKDGSTGIFAGPTLCRTAIGENIWWAARGQVFQRRDIV